MLTSSIFAASAHRAAADAGQTRHGGASTSQQRDSGACEATTSIESLLTRDRQELKGNIRVYCRVRPLGEQEAASSTENTHKISYPNDEEIRVQTIEKSNIGGADKLKEVGR